MRIAIMSRGAACAVLFLAAAAAPAAAGRIFGDIKLDGKPLAAGVPVRLAVAGEKGALLDTTRTDKFGSYKLMAKTEGKCTLTVTYDKQPVTLDVFSNAEATRYDLILEKKDGKLALRRK